MLHEDHRESRKDLSTEPMQPQKPDDGSLRERIALQDWLESLEKSGWLRLGEKVEVRLPRPIKENDPHE